MSDDEELIIPEGGGDPLLMEAIEALRLNDPKRARDLLTRLLKVDQNNAMYWVWLSAAVETQKERLYCLETAIKIDPENAAAKRGLLFFGARPLDPETKPFPLNRPRLWEEKLAEKPAKEKNPGTHKPLLRLLTIGGIGVAAIALLYVLFVLPNSPLAGLRQTPTRRFTRTPSPTATFTPEYRTATPTFLAPTPLWMLLPEPYTPTALYVNTEHPVTSRDAFDAAMGYFEDMDYQTTITLMEQILVMEPEAVDAYYYIGESEYMLGDLRAAQSAYQKAINIDPGFGPAYMGRALVNQALGNNENVLADLTRAIELDPSYDLPYVYRGAFRLELGDPETALGDLTTARTLKPTSALAHLYLAQVYLALEQNEKALEAAIQANILDATLLPAYLTLGKAYEANGRVEEAMGALQTYTLYVPDDIEAMIVLGAAYNARKEYNTAIDILSRAIALDDNNVEANYQRGVAYLATGLSDQAIHDFKVAVGYAPKHFEAAVGLAQAYDLDGFSGTAYVKMEAALGLAETDEEKALCLYYEALYLEKINDFNSAKDKWRALLRLPASAMSEEWRNTAMEHLGVTATPTKFSSPTPVTNLTTNTPRPTATP